MKYSVILKYKSRFLTIRYDIFINDVRLRGNTNFTIDRTAVKNQNPLKLKTNENFSKRDKNELEKKLNDFEYHIEKTKADLKNQNLFSPQDKLKEEIEIYFGRTKDQEEDKVKNLFEFIDYYIELKENTVTTKKGIKTRIGKSTIRDYRRFKKILEEYKDYKNITLDYKNINSTFLNNFVKYLENEARDKKGYKTNYIGKQIKHLKMFMSKSLNEHHHTNMRFNDFKVLKEDVESDYLDEDELDKLFRSSMTEQNPLLDYFLLQAFTGLRVEDTLRLTYDNIKEQENVRMITFLERKNLKKRVIKITPKMEQILNKWQGKFPNDILDKKVRRQSINEYLNFIKDKKITNHSGRRSFCTNEYIKGTPVEDIMRQSGHKNYTVFKSYIKDSGEKALIAMDKRNDL